VARRWWLTDVALLAGVVADSVLAIVLLAAAVAALLLHSSVAPLLAGIAAVWEVSVLLRGQARRIDRLERVVTRCRASMTDDLTSANR